MIAKERSDVSMCCTIIIIIIIMLYYSVSQRMASEDGMNCTEFLYPCFQAYDYLHLHTHHNCWIQVYPPSLSPSLLTSLSLCRLVVVISGVISLLVVSMYVRNVETLYMV